jgi:zinc transport system substrate-binding protein
MLIRKFYLVLFFLPVFACGHKSAENERPVITVSIPPYKYFVEKIAGDDFAVNVMVQAGANPHIYEPFPGQIARLQKSVAYISNGFLGFEMTWLDRFYEVNKTMKKLSLGDRIEPLESEHHHEGEHTESADPHYWVSPSCAGIMAKSLTEFLIELKPDRKDLYEKNYKALDSLIKQIGEKAERYFLNSPKKAFMIYHPNLGYLARDYGLEEISVEFEGKEPPPSWLKYLIDRAREEKIKTIFVQKEYDTKNAKAIASETGAEIVIIDPLSENWESSTMEIINAVHKSLDAGNN